MSTTDIQITAARESFSGKALTERQFSEAMAIADILQGEIKQTGSFREKLTDYAHAFARSERFDALRGETILRDIYAAKFGETLNQTREGLRAAEKDLPAIANTKALDQAEEIGQLIRETPSQPFYQAYDQASLALSEDLGVTQNKAKSLMKDAYEDHHGRDLYTVGKEIEAAYHRPDRSRSPSGPSPEQPGAPRQTRARA